MAKGPPQLRRPLDLRARAGGGDDVAAGVGEGEGHGLAEAAPGAGDDGGFAVEAELIEDCHGLRLLLIAFGGQAHLRWAGVAYRLRRSRSREASGQGWGSALRG